MSRFRLTAAGALLTLVVAASPYQEALLTLPGTHDWGLTQVVDCHDPATGARYTAVFLSFGSDIRISLGHYPSRRWGRSFAWLVRILGGGIILWLIVLAVCNCLPIGRDSRRAQQ